MIRVNQFACLCGAQDEGTGKPPACWLCAKPMHQWSVREADYLPFAMKVPARDS